MLKSYFFRFPILNYLIFGISLSFMLSCEPSGSYGKLVKDIDSFKETVKAAQPGDVITLANGVWTDTELLFMAEGTENAPITLTDQENTGPSWDPKEDQEVRFKHRNRIEAEPGENTPLEAVENAKSGDVFALNPGDYHFTKSIPVIHPISAESYISVGKQLMEKFPRCKNVIVTLRGSHSASHNSWSGVLYDGKDLHVSRTCQITHIVDRVDGGDSFMGGLIYGPLTYPENDQKAIDFALAASC